jgi:phage shock protein A
MSIFSKVRTIALSNIHTVLDATINLNSIGAVEQHVRDLEDARKDLEGTLAEARYDLRTRRSDLATGAAHAEKLTADIKLLLAQNDGAPSGEQRSAARQLAGQLAGLRETAAADEVAVAATVETEGKLREAVVRVNARETEMKQRVGTLRAQVSSTQAKQRAAGALDAVSSAVAAGGSIDGAADRIGRENARADAAFDRAVGELPGADPSAGAKADAILAELSR